MLQFANFKDVAIKNHFKNWIISSNENFIIILNTVLKDIIKFTNWNFDKHLKVVYRVPFNCERMIESLGKLEIIYNVSPTTFI